MRCGTQNRSATSDRFDQEQMFQWIKDQVSMGPRRAGSVADRQNEDYIEGHLRDFGHGWLGGRQGLAVSVAIEAFSDLLADDAAGQALGGDDARAEAGLVVVLGIDRLHHRMRHIERNCSSCLRLLSTPAGFGK